MAQAKYNPHPGEILDEEFLQPLGLSQKALAEAIGVPSNRINAIVRGTRNISADTDLRLSRYFGLSIGFWLRLQQTYDLMEAQKKAGAEIKKIKPHAKRSSKVAA